MRSHVPMFVDISVIYISGTRGFPARWGFEAAICTDGDALRQPIGLTW